MSDLASLLNIISQPSRILLSRYTTVELFCEPLIQKDNGDSQGRKADWILNKRAFYLLPNTLR